MCGRRFCSGCSATSAGEQRDGAAVDVTLRSVSSPTLRSFAREVDAGGKYRRQRCRDSNVAQFLRRRWFAAPPDGNCHRAHRRGDGLEAPLGATASRMFAFPPPGGQFRLTNNRAGLANAAGRLLSPASLASRPRKRSVPAERKQWRFCSHGAVAQSYRHH